MVVPVAHQECTMARADKHDLHRSRIEMDRQQRQEEPIVEGAFGGEDDSSPEAAEIKARKRLGKTEQHTHDDRPGA
jgi:hypothetical protein